MYVHASASNTQRAIAPPPELMIQAAPLEALAQAQALGGPFYGAAVLPPWQRPGWEIPADAREALDLGGVAGVGAGAEGAGAGPLEGGGGGPGGGSTTVYGPAGVPRYNWTDTDDRAIYRMRVELGLSFKVIAERLGKGTTTTVRSRFMNYLQDGTFLNPGTKKKQKQKLAVQGGGVQKPAAAAPAAALQSAGAPVAAGTAGAGGALGGAPADGKAAGEAGAPAGPPAPERIPNRELASGLYNKVVHLEGGRLDEKGRPQLYFVLVYDADRERANLVEMYQRGFFGAKSSRAHKPRFSLMPEGEGEELLDVEASRCTIVRSEAAYKLASADKEAWELMEDPWASERRPGP